MWVLRLVVRPSVARAGTAARVVAAAAVAKNCRRDGDMARSSRELMVEFTQEGQARGCSAERPTHLPRRSVSLKTAISYRRRGQVKPVVQRGSSESPRN